MTARIDGVPHRVLRTEFVDELEQANSVSSVTRAIRNAFAFKKMSGVSWRGMVREGLAMKREGNLKWTQVILAANTPMLLRAGLVEGRLDAGVLSSGQVAGRDRRSPERRRTDRAHHERGGADVEGTFMKTRIPAVENWFTTDESAPALSGARGVESGSYYWPTAVAVSGNPSAPGEAREPVELSRTGKLWSWTTNHYAPPEPYVAPDPFVPYTVCAVELGREQMVVLGGLGDRRRSRRPRGRHGDGARARAAVRGRRARVRRVAVGAVEEQVMTDIAILGAGMHPWGKWGRNFVEYGVVAAQAALADAGVAWPDIQFVSGADTMRNGYPGYVAGATFAQALGWNGAQVASSYAACASGVTALATARAQILAGFCDVALVIGADTTPKGFLAPNKGERGDDPDWLRFRLLGATNPTFFGLYARRRMELFGATRDDFARVKVKNAQAGLGNQYARYKKAVTVDDVLTAPIVSDPLGLLDICATSDGAAASSCRRSTTRNATASRTRCASAASRP